ncbi:MAG: D-glucuronyl C5-epimerase family protein [candidate division WOR-3 bacterium]
MIIRINYLRRIFASYLTPLKSQLTFWYEEPAVNKNLTVTRLGEYYMPFLQKANYSEYLDANGVPRLNYHGKIGLQYNPIAIAQYGLGNYNIYKRTGEVQRFRKFLLVADWLVNNLERNCYGLAVWNHHFDWEYKTPLKAPWYSGLAQGQGISLLVRAYKETKNDRYLNTAKLAFESFLKTTKAGGVIYTGDNNYTWIEEYIVEPPTHILNGCIWALWGVYDYYLLTKDTFARNVFEKVTESLKNNLQKYDTGFWSLYEISNTKMKMLASPFYHHLHICQLNVMYKLTKERVFQDYAIRWENYRRNFFKKSFAFFYKSLFKLLYY